MTFPRFLAIFSIALFTIIGLIALFKETPSPSSSPPSYSSSIEIETKPEVQLVSSKKPQTVTKEKKVLNETEANKEEDHFQPEINLPDADLMAALFEKDGHKLPIVETIVYKSRVAWQKGRPAWLSDYAKHYQTSRHFIARSLNGRADYLTQEVKEGDQFNVLRKEVPFQFYLLVDASRCKMWFYYIDLVTKQAALLKTYQVGLGRLDAAKASGSLTPLGKYLLGDRIMTYRPGAMGIYLGKKTEMITVFGTRWIPFEKEISGCTAAAKGFGVHGTPWQLDANGQLADTKQGIGLCESDGCIRLQTADMEELFAIIVTKPTVIEIVSDFSQATFLN